MNWLNFFSLFKYKIIYNFVIFAASKKGRTTNFSPTLLLLLLLDPGSGSEISKSQDPE